MKKNLKLMFVVGENSGDSHAAKLVEALKKCSTEIDFEFFGTTGPKMRKAGVETVFEADEFSVVGVPEVIKAVPMFWRIFKKLKTVAVEKKPDAIVLIDFPEFNLKLAKALKKQGIKVIYYISPQLWAWRKYRLRGIKKYVDLLLTIMPFEKDWYEKHNINHVEYVGNPLAGKVKPVLTRREFCDKYDFDDSEPIISLLGGSRKKELEHILPVLLETVSLMSKKDEHLQFVIPFSSTCKKSDFDDDFQKVVLENPKLSKKLLIVQNETYEALNASDAAAVTSGTATLETAIIGTPLVIIYKTSMINYALIKPLIKLDYYGLVNLIAGKKLAEELIQNDLTPQTLSRELFKLLEKENNKKMREDLSKIEKSLGDGKSSELAAIKILNELSF